MIIYREGSLFDTQLEMIAHGVNTQGAFGAGVARAIAIRYPEVKQVYTSRHKAGLWTLGDIQIVPIYSQPGPIEYVVNIATQATYGRNKIQHVSYEAIQTGFNTLLNQIDGKTPGIAIPKIGTGLGGGNWQTILDIITQELAHKKITIEVWTI